MGGLRFVQKSTSALSMAVSDMHCRASAVLAASLWIARSVEAAAFAAFVPMSFSWKRPRSLPIVELESSSEMSATPPSGKGRWARAAAAGAAAPDEPVSLSNLPRTFQHLTESAALLPQCFTTVRPLAFHATWKPTFTISSLSKVTFHVARFLRDSLYASNICYSGLHLFSGSYGHAD